MAGEFPEDVRRFVIDHIDSVEQLEVLLLLRRGAGKEWNAVAVSQLLYTQPEAAARRLADLADLGLLAVSTVDEPFYRYRPATPELAALVDRLAPLYEQRRVSLISLIYSKPNPRVQAFADAFRLRKEKP